jgi:uncharacterized protein YggE
MKKFITILIIFVLGVNTIFAEQDLNINLDENKYVSDFVQAQKLQYEREALKYNGSYMVIGTLDNIVGTGTIKLSPEFFTLTFELKTNSSKFGMGDSKEAQVKAAEENTKVMNEFKTFLISVGVKDEDMTTTQYSVKSVSKTLSNAADVVHRLKVKFYLPAKIGDVYKKIEPTDIKVIDEPVYGASEKSRKEAKLLAYEYALKDIFTQAETLAKFGKFEVGDIKSVNEDNGQLQFRTNRQSQANVFYESTDLMESGFDLEEKTSVPYSVAQEMTVSIALVCSFDMIKKINK